jgi:hypothetical protein
MACRLLVNNKRLLIIHKKKTAPIQNLTKMFVGNLIFITPSTPKRCLFSICSHHYPSASPHTSL